MTISEEDLTKVTGFDASGPIGRPFFHIADDWLQILGLAVDDRHDGNKHSVVFVSNLGRAAKWWDYTKLKDVDGVSCLVTDKLEPCPSRFDCRARLFECSTSTAVRNALEKVQAAQLERSQKNNKKHKAKRAELGSIDFWSLASAVVLRAAINREWDFDTKEKPSTEQMGMVGNSGPIQSVFNMDMPLRFPSGTAIMIYWCGDMTISLHELYAMELFQIQKEGSEDVLLSAGNVSILDVNNVQSVFSNIPMATSAFALKLH